MIKCIRFMAIVSIIILNDKVVQGRPQEMQEAAVIAVAQAKDAFEDGAAASNKKEFDIFGARIKTDVAVGFGDAARSKRSNHHHSKEDSNTQQIKNSKENFIVKRETTNDNSIIIENGEDDDYSFSSLSSSSSAEYEDSERRKRSNNFDEFAEEMKTIYLQ